MQFAPFVRIGFAVILLAGCASRTDRGAELAGIRSLHVAPAISSSLSDAGSRLEPALLAAATRMLTSRGYAVGPEADAQAFVRIAWILGRDIAPDGRPERTLSLSLSIFSRSGERLYSARSVEDWPERMWSEDRAASVIGQMLRDMPECHPAPVPADAKPVPAEGRPALAPIRLK